MNSKKSIYLPPLKKNCFRKTNHSVQPNKKRTTHFLNLSAKPTTNLLVRVSKYRDLSVSPHYLQYHRDIINRSRFSLFDEINKITPPLLSLIPLVKINDFKLEHKRNFY